VLLELAFGPPRSWAAPFAGMMDERHRGMEVTLQVAKVSEKWRDLGCGVFVNAMQANEGIEHAQCRLELGDGRG
jgi:hypothetical protein